MMVEAMIRLYPGGPGEPLTPWPMRRVPGSLARGPTRQSWQALAEAERVHRRKAKEKSAYTEAPGEL